jgi:hypothetical protein
MNGKITIITKIFTVTVLAAVGMRLKIKTDTEKSVLFGMLVSGILLYLSNYWPQYQVILIIPMLGLLAYAISSKSTALYWVLIISGIAMGAEEMWFGELIKSAITLESPQDTRPITEFSNQHSSLVTEIYFFPLTWILHRIKDLVFLLPLIFFSISAGVLIKK